MQKLNCKITTLSPLIFSSSGGETNTVFTKEFIPGTIVLGVMAGKYIQKKNLKKEAHIDNFFYECFLKGSLRFTNACIVSKDEEGKIKKNYPIPLSIHQIKHDDKRIYDLLFTGEDFHEPTHTIGGFGRIEGKSVFKQEVRKSLHFHHQHDAVTGTVKKGLFFNYQSIDPGQVFMGSISGEEKYLNIIKEMIDKEEVFYMGRSRNSQYGKVKFEILSDSQIPDYKIGKLENADNEISLTLLSNTIIFNDMGFSTINPKQLEREFENKYGLNIEIKKSFVRSGEIENFVSVWRLRRPSEICFLAGSCFLLEISEDQRTKLLDIERNGIGERIGEGFGEIVFWMQRPEPLKLKENAKIPPIFQNNILDKTKEILKELIKNVIEKQVESEAMEVSGKFNLKLTKSLVGKLEFLAKNKNINDFRKLIDKFPKDATDKLEACYNKDEKKDLKQFLKTNSVTVENIFSKTTDLKKDVEKLLKEAKIDLKFLKDIEPELYRLYFKTFFAVMRKRIKMSEIGGG